MKGRLVLLVLALTVCELAAGVRAARATEFFASSAAQITTALNQAQAGDIVTLLNGTWTNQSITLSKSGTAAKPITVRAQTPGQVLLNGTSKLSINGAYLVVDGLRFEGGALTGGVIVTFTGSAHNSRFTNSAIIDYNPPAIITEVDWLQLNGQDNRVDHNIFKNHNSIGQTVEVRHTIGTPDRHLIDNNYFADRPVGDGNGWETIRIGLSGVAQDSSYSIVENNLFERVDGENEAISNKSSNNTYRYNTFRDTKATLTLRHGNDGTVEGNFFLGDNISGTGGVRVIGERHKIINNYFQGIDDNGGGAIAINRGEVDVQPTGYQQVKDVVIAHNTIVDTLGTLIRFDAGDASRALLPQNVTVANNVLRSNGPTVFTGTEGAGWTWQGNLAYGASLGPKAGAAGISNVNPQLVQGTDGLWRLGASSPAINAAVGTTSSLVPNDMDGQARIGIADIGADEFSSATIVRRPLVSNDVGPAWLHVSAPTYPGFGPFGCVIQAEDYTQILDPDGDGHKWTVMNIAGALGGKVLAAPAGDRVDPPGETHDTIATYALRFQTPGTYTAYYRTRGIDSAKNSIYSPDGFGVDPDNNQTLSDDGSFTWIKDATTFEITSSNVGVPLELRLGMREEQSQIDALVLSLDGSMTSSALDVAFSATTPLLGDFNGDHVVDGADLLIVQRTLGSTTQLAADTNGNGVIDASDLAAWVIHAGETQAGGVMATPEPSAAAMAAWAAMLGLILRRRGVCKA